MEGGQALLQPEPLSVPAPRQRTLTHASRLSTAPAGHLSCGQLWPPLCPAVLLQCLLPCCCVCYAGA